MGCASKERCCPNPNRAIYPTLIALVFQSIRNPILLRISSTSRDSMDYPACVDEILQVRHHNLFAPWDFDVTRFRSGQIDA